MSFSGLAVARMPGAKDMKTLPVHWDGTSGGDRSPPARDICRGVSRLFKAYGFAPSARSRWRAGDGRTSWACRKPPKFGLSKSSRVLEIFASIKSRPQYREFCDRFFFCRRPDVSAPGVARRYRPDRGGSLWRGNITPRTRPQTRYVTTAGPNPATGEDRGFALAGGARSRPRT